MTFRKDWIEDFLNPRWCRTVYSSLGIMKQESCLDEQERNKKMEYNIDDVINLKNDAGVFKIKVLGGIESGNARMGFSEAMRFNGYMRLELHKGYCGQYIITMTSREDDEDSGKIIVCAFDSDSGRVRYYLGKIIQYENEEDVFELMK